jgi:hypothetical protein
MSVKQHWDKVWTEREDDELSWHQRSSEPCGSRVRQVTQAGGRVAVVGAGSSVLVDDLATDYLVVAVDVAADALARLGARLGPQSGVTMLVGDVRTVDLGQPVDTWHDRAVFHFLTDPDDRRAYRDTAWRSILPGGHLVIATFAPTGPEQCSGLAVQRYDADQLADELGTGCVLLDAQEHVHETPWGSLQAFTHSTFRRGDQPSVG